MKIQDNRRKISFSWVFSPRKTKKKILTFIKKLQILQLLKNSSVCLWKNPTPFEYPHIWTTPLYPFDPTADIPKGRPVELPDRLTTPVAPIDIVEDQIYNEELDLDPAPTDDLPQDLNDDHGEDPAPADNPEPKQGQKPDKPDCDPKPEDSSSDTPEEDLGDFIFEEPSLGGGIGEALGKAAEAIAGWIGEAIESWDGNAWGVLEMAIQNISSFSNFLSDHITKTVMEFFEMTPIALLDFYFFNSSHFVLSLFLGDIIISAIKGKPTSLNTLLNKIGIKSYRSMFTWESLNLVMSYLRFVYVEFIMSINRRSLNLEIYSRFVSMHQKIIFRVLAFLYIQAILDCYLNFIWEHGVFFFNDGEYFIKQWTGEKIDRFFIQRWFIILLILVSHCFECIATIIWAALALNVFSILNQFSFPLRFLSDENYFKLIKFIFSCLLYKSGSRFVAYIIFTLKEMKKDFSILKKKTNK